MKKKHPKYATAVFALAVAIICSLPISAMANEMTKDSTPVELKYIGSINNQPVFQLNLDGAENDEFSISITDGNGDLLYFDKVKGKNFSRKFQVNTEEIMDGRLFVEIKERKSSKGELYEINSKTRLVQENLVSRL